MWAAGWVMNFSCPDLNQIFGTTVYCLLSIIPTQDDFRSRADSSCGHEKWWKFFLCLFQILSVKRFSPDEDLRTLESWNSQFMRCLQIGTNLLSWCKICEKRAVFFFQATKLKSMKLFNLYLRVHTCLCENIMSKPAQIGCYKNCIAPTHLELCQ